LLERLGPLAILGRHPALFSAILVAFIAISLASYFLLPVSYVAIGSIIVEEQELGIGNNSPTVSQKVGDPADMESQLLVIRSERVMQKAVGSPEALAALRSECEADGGADFDGDCSSIGNRLDKLVDYTSKRYGVAAIGRSRIINISYKSSNPEIARAMANALIDAFLIDQKEGVSSGRRSAAGWLRQELGRLDVEIRKLDQEIGNYRASKGLVRGVSAPINAERLTGISQQLAVAQAAQATAEAQLKEVNDDKIGGTANSTPVLGSRTIADLKQQIAETDMALANSEATLGPSHPRWRALSDQSKLLNDRLASEVDRIAKNAEKQYNAASDRVAALNTELETLKSDVVSSSGDERTIENLVRDVEIKRRQYTDLAARANTLETEERILSGSVRLISAAGLPLKPFFPKLVPILAAGITLGLLFGFVAAFLADKLALARQEPAPRGGTTVAEPDPVAPPPAKPAHPQNDDAPRRAKTAVAHLLTMVPRVRPQQPASRAGSLLDFGRHPLLSALDASATDPAIREAFDQLTWALGNDLSPGTSSAGILLLTSPTAGSGKTFTTLALARHLAASGKAVLVVECNRERPSISEAFGVPATYGWGAVASNDFLRKSPFDGLDIIVAGGASRSLAAADWEDRLDDILDWAASRYALVLIDGPSGDTVDAQKLADHADAVLVCAKEGEVDSDRMSATIADIHAAGHDNVGVIVTMVDDRRLAATQPQRRHGT